MKHAIQNGTAESSPDSHRALGIEEVCRACGLGRTTVFAAIRAGDLVARRYGRRTIVLTDDLADFLHGLPTTKPAGPHDTGGDA